MKLSSNKAWSVAGTIIIVVVAITAYHILFQQGGQEATEILYVQTATSGALTPTEEEGVWQLSLAGVSPETTYFSDRPAREAGNKTTADFIREWALGDDSFAADPPNAALEILNDGRQEVFPVELLNPRYDEAADSLVYDILFLAGEPTETEAYEAFEETSLFIDSTYQVYNCNCEPADGSSHCSCDYVYRLAPLQTKEFRASCNGRAQNLADDVDGDGLSVDVNVRNKKRSTSCTVEYTFWWYDMTYESKSCTNFSPVNGDNMDVEVRCNY